MHNGTTLVSKIRIIIRFPFPFIYVEQTCIHQFLYNMFIVHQIPYSPVHLCPDFKKHPSQFVLYVFVRVVVGYRIYFRVFVYHKVIVNGFSWRCICDPSSIFWLVMLMLAFWLVQFFHL